MSLVVNQRPKMMIAKPDEITMHSVSSCGWQMKASKRRETDELSHAAVENPFHVKHLSTAVLHQFDLNPKTLTYFHGGMDQKLVETEEVEPIHHITVQHCSANLLARRIIR